MSARKKRDVKQPLSNWDIYLMGNFIHPWGREEILEYFDGDGDAVREFVEANWVGTQTKAGFRSNPTTRPPIWWAFFGPEELRNAHELPPEKREGLPSAVWPYGENGRRYAELQWKREQYLAQRFPEEFEGDTAKPRPLEYFMVGVKEETDGD